MYHMYIYTIYIPVIYTTCKCKQQKVEKINHHRMFKGAVAVAVFVTRWNWNWSWSWLPIALVRDCSPSVLTPPQLETYSPYWEDAHAPVKCERNDRWSVVTAYRPDVRQWISLAMTISADFGALIIWVDIIRRHSGRQSHRQSRSSISRRHSYGSSVRCVTQSWPPEPPSPPKHDLSQNTSEAPRGLRTQLKCIVRVHTRHRA